MGYVPRLNIRENELNTRIHRSLLTDCECNVNGCFLLLTPHLPFREAIAFPKVLCTEALVPSKSSFQRKFRGSAWILWPLPSSVGEPTKWSQNWEKLWSCEPVEGRGLVRESGSLGRAFERLLALTISYLLLWLLLTMGWRIFSLQALVLFLSLYILENMGHNIEVSSSTLVFSRILSEWWQI